MSKVNYFYANDADQVVEITEIIGVDNIISITYEPCTIDETGVLIGGCYCIFYKDNDDEENTTKIVNAVISSYTEENEESFDE